MSLTANLNTDKNIDPSTLVPHRQRTRRWMKHWSTSSYRYEEAASTTRTTICDEVKKLQEQIGKKLKIQITQEITKGLHQLTIFSDVIFAEFVHLVFLIFSILLPTRMFLLSLDKDCIRER